MLDPALRPLKDRLLAPVARAISPWADPLAITLLGFAAGAGCVALLALGLPGPALGLWIANRTLDGLDGLVARTSGRQSDLGGYLDIVLDFAVYAAIPIAAAARHPDAAGLPVAALLAVFYVNAASWMYLSALLEKRALAAASGRGPTSVALPPGLIEGSETIIFFIAFILLPDRLTTLFWSMSVLLLLTIAQRIAWAVRHLPGTGAPAEPLRSTPPSSAP
jgi:phosphatidylglycerophosphate synthase